MSEMRRWISDRLDEGKPVQVAVTYSNTCWWPYLTTSGKVCREEHGFVEDVEDEWPECFPVNSRSWSSIVRLQKVLMRANQGGER